MNRRHLDSLTWLRAIAAIFVLISHCYKVAETQYAITDEPSYFFPIKLLDLGTFGVYLFFALSGCTLFISNRSKVNSIGSIGGFYAKRFFRIWPPFAVSLIVYLLFIEVFKELYTSEPTFWVAAQFFKEYSLVDVLHYLSLTFNLTGPKGLFIYPYWSLPVEFQYYLMLPLVMILMKFKPAFIYPVLISALLYLVYANKLIIVDRLDVFQMAFTFFGGVLLAKIYLNINIRLPLILSLFLFLIVSLIAGLIRNDIVQVPEQILFFSNKWNMFGALALISVFIALITKPIKKSNWLSRFIFNVGEISYSIYLYHMLFIGLAVLLVLHFEIYGDTPKLLFIFSFSFISSYLFSKWAFLMVEKPSMKLGKRLSNS
ncbi:acyltransferase [Alteromonadaceae bacterium BrNp21-10]|nr:acyltransferase [Alteromonadaceae bacterium BrNp21-10]